MSIAAERLAGRSVPAFLTLGFRPFFLAAAVWSAAALALWITILASGGVLPSRFDPLTWHIHEMLIGFALAAIFEEHDVPAELGALNEFDPFADHLFADLVCRMGLAG